MPSPATDDELFETLTAAVFCARFRPETVEARWPAIRAAFAGLSLATVASWPDSVVTRLLAMPGMIRSPKKVLATLRNARDLAERGRLHGSVRAYLDAFPADEALVAELDSWAHYAGAPSLRRFVRCVRAGSPGRIT